MNKMFLIVLMVLGVFVLESKSAYTSAQVAQMSQYWGGWNPDTAVPFQGLLALDANGRNYSITNLASIQAATLYANTMNLNGNSITSWPSFSAGVVASASNLVGAISTVEGTLVASDSIISTSKIGSVVLGGEELIQHIEITTNIGTWNEEGSLPLSVYGHASVVEDGKIYSMGGYNSGTKGSVYSFDGINTWITLPSLLSNMSGFAVATLNSNIYVIGGINSNNNIQSGVYKYDGASWTIDQSLPTRRANLSAVTLNGNIYAVGGMDEFNVAKSNVYAFDGASWTEKDSLPTALYGLSAVVLNNKIYSMGGYDGLSARSVFYKYDGVNPWTEVNSQEVFPWEDPIFLFLPVSLYGLSSVVLNDKIYIIGGTDGTNIQKSVYAWEGGSSWITGQSLPLERANLSAVTLNNKIYAMGGKDSLSAAKSSIFTYDGINTSVTNFVYTTNASMAVKDNNNAILQVGSSNLFPTGDFDLGSEQHPFRTVYAQHVSSLIEEDPIWLSVTNVQTIMPILSSNSMWELTGGCVYDESGVIYTWGPGNSGNGTATGMPDIVVGKTYQVNFKVAVCSVRSSGTVTFGGNTWTISASDSGQSYSYLVFATGTDKFKFEGIGGIYGGAEYGCALQNMSVKVMPRLYFNGDIFTARMNFSRCPVSSNNLQSGDVWNSNGFLRIMP